MARRSCLLLTLLSFLLSSCSKYEGSRSESGSLAEHSALISTSAAQARPNLERQLIRTVMLDLEVESLASARQRAEALVQAAGGFVESLDSTRVARSQQLSLTLRVPRDALEKTLASARKLGRATRETQQVEDVTRKYIDVDARLRNLQRTEQRLLALLDAPQAALADVLAVERELSRVREENEVLDAELRGLKEQVALCTLKLLLVQEADAEAPDSMWTPWRRLWRNIGPILAESLGALLGFGAALITGALYLLPWLPLLVLLGYGLKRLRSWRRKRK